jgi:hypothetical protein
MRHGTTYMYLCIYRHAIVVVGIHGHMCAVHMLMISHNRLISMNLSVRCGSVLSNIRFATVHVIASRHTFAVLIAAALDAL